PHGETLAPRWPGPGGRATLAGRSRSFLMAGGTRAENERTMNPTEPKTQHVSELEARAVAEASRETAWEAPSFVRELFLGRLDLGLIHPWPEPDPEEQRRAAEFLDRLERFVAERVDSEAIEHDARVPETVIQGLRELGAFGI